MSTRIYLIPSVSSRTSPRVDPRYCSGRCGSSRLTDLHGEQLGGGDNFAAQVGEADALAVLNALLGSVLRVQEHARPAFALARGWRLGERGIEVILQAGVTSFDG